MTATELRAITTDNGLTFPDRSQLVRWGGVDADYLFGLCPLCHCPKNGNAAEPNQHIGDLCDRADCPCHDEGR